MKIINVCIGSACHLKGAYNVINHLQKIIEEKNLIDHITVKAAFCLGECTKSVSVKIDDGPIISVDDNNVEEFFSEYILGSI